MMYSIQDGERTDLRCQSKHNLLFWNSVKSSSPRVTVISWYNTRIERTSEMFVSYNDFVQASLEEYIMSFNDSN
jgi:hypothetical protein